MKTRNQATALVITLVLLMLLTGVAIAFFTQVNVESRSAKSFSDSVTTKQLADSAVSAVMSNIREAATTKNGAWVSQPGMIKVFGANDKASEQPAAYYKLYSSDNMVLGPSDAKAFDSGSTNDVPIDWKTKPAFYTDLNEPGLRVMPDPYNADRVGPTLRYPIIDPRLAETKVGKDTLTSIPAGYKSSVVEGFQIDGSPAGLPDNGKTAQAPMPVRWLYVLRDGTLTAPQTVDALGTTVKWAVPHTDADARRTPSKSNPIVGRVAFWADDDSSRININTAGGYCMAPIGFSSAQANYNIQNYAGSFWDTPRMNTLFEVGRIFPDTSANAGKVSVGGLARCQPSQGEYQRYPGHPMTTSLSVVFSDGYNTGSNAFGASSWQINMTSELLYKMTPRVANGGSMGGMRRARDFTDKNGLITPELDSKALVPRYDRLYASTDELMFAPPVVDTSNAKEYDYTNGRRTFTDGDQSGPAGRLNQFVSENNTNWASEANYTDLKINYQQGSITPNVIDRVRFFLTAHSRAPELNLFGRPRITIWPIWDETHKQFRTRHDNLFYFCSTLGPQPAPASTNPPEHVFEFARRDALSSSTDVNIAQNVKLLHYLQDLTSSSIPGYPSGSTFVGKYGSDRDQILTEIFDYIRTVNLKDVNLDKDSLDPLYGYSRYAPLGLVVPTRVSLGRVATKGLGRFPTVTEAALVFYHAGWVGVRRGAKVPVEETIDATVKLTGSTTLGQYLKNYDIKAMLMRAYLAFETFDPMEGYAPISSTGPSPSNMLMLHCDFTGGWSVTVPGAPAATGAPLKFISGDKRIPPSGNGWGGRNFGGYEGVLHTLMPIAPETIYPYSTPHDGAIRIDYQAVTVPPNTPAVPPAAPKNFNFSGGVAKLQVKFGSQTIQTMTLNFPGGTGWPVPVFTFDNLAQNNPNPQIIDGIWFDFGNNSNNGRLRDYWRQLPSQQTPPPSVVSTAGGGQENALSFETRLAWARQYAGGYINEPAGNDFGDRWRQILQPGDTVRSLTASGIPASAKSPGVATAAVANGGDHRLTALYSEDGLGASGTLNPGFCPHVDYATGVRQAESLRIADGSVYFPGGGKNKLGLSDPSVPLYPGYAYNPTQHGNLVTLPPNTYYPSNVAADLERTINGVTRFDGGAGDVDTGIGSFPDGAFANKADEGNVTSRYWDNYYQVWRYPIAYFGAWTYEAPGDTFFSPNRQVPSPFVFGSLPSNALKGHGWETLCLNPTIPLHPGLLTSPKDHLLLDLFSMPVVEPYAISEPFSTAGKINLNYQIQPFTYIHRSTALRAALHPVRVSAVPPQHIATYKSGFTSGIEPAQSDFGTPVNYRLLVDRDETIRAIEGEVFQSKAPGALPGNVFRTASEICERFFYPKGQNGLVAQYVPSGEKGPTSMTDWWARMTLTGDNLREKAYADIYSRITTKSNTFTVYVRSQVLRQPPASGVSAGTDQDAPYRTFKDNAGAVFAEYRGESTIERYLDPQDRRFNQNDPITAQKGDYISPETDSIEAAFRFRTVYSKRFVP